MSSTRRTFIRADDYRLDPLESRRLLAATVIDVMVVYSNNALAGFSNSEPAIQKAIRQSIDIANLAHQNTADNIVLRLVYTGLINYTSTAPESTQLSDLKANSTVAALRNTYGADLVSMIVSAPEGGGGLGDLLQNPAGSPTQAFCVVGYPGIGQGNLVLAHEFGHNMGAGHERDNSTEYSEGVFPAYSFGYHTAEDGSSLHGTDYGDVMSYAGATLPVFANPSYIHDGVPIGQPIGAANAADLHSTFLATGPVVANYRSTVVGNAGGPTATLWQTDVSGNQLTFQIRYVDDTAVSAASIGSTGVYVQTPEGFKLTPAFLGLDVAGDGYARTATYRVTLPGNLPAVSSLVFGVNADAVKDTSNVGNIAATLSSNPSQDLDQGYGQAQLARDTGTLAIGTTRRLTGRIGDVNDFQDMYKFTLTSATNVRVTVSGVGGALTSDPVLFMYDDANLNEVIDSGEVLGNSYETGTADKSMSLSLTPGTYYVYLQLASGHAATDYTLTMSAPAADAVAPSAPVLDKADSAHTGTTSTIDFYVKFTDDVGIDPNSVLYDGYLWFFTPTGNGYCQTPSDVTVSGKSVIAHYRKIDATAFGTGTMSVRLSNTTGFETAVTDLAGNLLPVPTGTPPYFGTYKVGTLPSDTTAPTPSIYSAPTMVVPPALTTYDFTIAYAENRGVNQSTLDNSDIRVTGPNSFNQAATLVAGSVSLSPGGGTTYATYRITAPGGSWDYTDYGNYSIVLQPAQVKDAAGNSAGSATVATTVGTFLVNLPLPGDTNFSNSVDFADLVAVAQNYNQSGRGLATGDLNYDGVVNFTDLVMVAQNYNRTRPAAAPAVMDPPASSADSTTPTPLITSTTTATTSAVATLASTTTTTTFASGTSTITPSPARFPKVRKSFPAKANPRRVVAEAQRISSPAAPPPSIFATAPLVRSRNDLLA